MNTFWTTFFIAQMMQMFSFDLIADIMTYIQGAGFFYVSISFSLIFQSAQLTPLSSRTTGILMLAS